MILAGHAGSLRDMLRANPALASRFPAVIDFPDYTAGVFAALAGEAGVHAHPEVARKAAVLARTKPATASATPPGCPAPDHATASQACRITIGPQPPDPAMLSTIYAADKPEYVHVGNPFADDWPGQYL